MRKIVLLIMIAMVGLWFPGVLRAQSMELNAESVEMMAQHFRFFVVIDNEEGKPIRYVYADTGPHIHVHAVEKGRSVQQWESSNLGSPVRALVVKDVNADGNRVILMATAGGRVVAWDAESYERVAENFLRPFESIQSMASVNIDDDPADELILIGVREASFGSLLYIYDSATGAEQWVSQDQFNGTEIVVANVDDDPQVEIITNTGWIVDSRFYYIESSSIKSATATAGFGQRIRLLDINGDGIPEIFGETPGFPLKVYDIYGQTQLW